MRVLKYVEKCTGTNHDGPAWIAWVQTSRTGRTIYFNGCALRATTGGGGVGNHYDVDSQELYWVSGVKKSGSNRHWSGAGHILVEESAVKQFLELTNSSALDASIYRVAPDLPLTRPEDFVGRLNEEP